MTKRTDARRAIPVDENGRRECDTDTRIAIIGGGCSGVTAAYKLHEKGYRNITLYEASDRVGGKVHSVEIDGHVVEVGAITSLKDNTTIQQMARELGELRVTRFKPKIVVVRKRRDGSTEKVAIDRYWGNSAPLSVARGLLRFWRIVWLSRFKSAFMPGFYNLHPDLVNLTMSEFARKHGFRAILDPFYTTECACGYGLMDEIPAVYALKMMKSIERVRLRRQITLGRNAGLYTFAGGYQRFWEGIARGLLDAGLDLRLGSGVTHVVRRTLGNGHSEIAVTADGKTEAYDRLFVTSPPDRTLEFMDATDEERELFSRVSYFNYHAVVFRAEGLKRNETVVMRDNMTPDRHGHLFVYLNNAPGLNLFVGYQSDDASRSDERLDELLRRDISELGARVDEIVVRKGWRYFPHVKLRDLDSDYYPRLNALQGKLGTYYLGALFAFETTDHCAQFADVIVNRCGRGLGEEETRRTE